MIKKIAGMASIITALAAIAVVGGCNKCCDAPLASSKDFKLGAGVNISHWLSQRDDGMPDPREFFTKEDVQFIADQGFDHIRLPIEESIMWTESGDPDEVAFETLDMTLGWIKEAGLTAIVDLHIINSHHFNAENDGEADRNVLFTDPAAQDHLTELWKELSIRLKKWPESMLAYEVLNEAVADDHEDWNKLVAKCIASIRKDEATRVLVIGSNKWQGAWSMKFLKVPEDDPFIILSFHTYHPHAFTHYKASWTGEYSSYTGPINYPGLLVSDEYIESMPDGHNKDFLKSQQGPNNKESLREHVMEAVVVARELDLPLYCGEWGCMKTVDEQQMLQWYRDMSDVLKEEGVDHAIWDYKGHFGIRDRDTPNAEPFPELIKAILDGN
ncbi:MAG: glycoside hydrolase family 5 protein [Puniceicoccaceae bacterium]